MRSDAEAGRRRQWVARLGAVALIVALGSAPASASSATQEPGATQAYPAFGLRETSGLTLSVLHPGVVWVNEDSGEPIVRAFDASGTQVASVLFQASDVFAGDNRDTEALAMGPGPTLWSADIGDNDGVRTTVLVHTTPEPAELSDTTVTATSYRFRYPDGPRDAEAFLVDPLDGRAYIATKAVLGAGWYAAPSALTPGATHDLTRVQNLPGFLTDGAFSPDGSMVALRTTDLLGGPSTAVLYEVVRTGSAEPDRLDQLGEVALPAQAQGESLGFTLDGRALLAGSEGTDEPIWSVPLPADLASPEGGSGEPQTGSPPTTPRSGTASVTGAPALAPVASGCRIGDLGACAAAPNAILVVLVLALVALLAALVALRRGR